MRVRIWIEGNARGRALRFVFGPRRRRRLTARVIPLGSLAELSALWRRVFCLVSGLTWEAASWDTQLPTPSTRLREEGMSLGSFVDPDFVLRLLKEEKNLPRWPRRGYDALPVTNVGTVGISPPGPRRGKGWFRTVAHLEGRRRCQEGEFRMTGKRVQHDTETSR